MKKVLIVDDSVVARHMVKEAVASLPGFQAITANNGSIALEKATRLRPDLVILDLNMEPMDGMEVLARLRELVPESLVIILSAHSPSGAKASLDALSMGASDFIPKPSAMEGGVKALDYLRSELLPRVKSLVARKRRNDSGWVPAPPPVVPAPASANRLLRTDLVVIASSTGGPNALEKILSSWEGPLHVPMAIVQHMSATFMPLLAERLASKSPLPIKLAANDMRCDPGSVYLAPGDCHLKIVREDDAVLLRLVQDPPENSCRPAANVLFRSAAETFGARALAAVLTGMGQDGLKGCEALKAAGAHVLAQDQESSVVWGMPGSVAQAGLADEILSLDTMRGRMQDLVRVGRNRC